MGNDANRKKTTFPLLITIPETKSVSETVVVLTNLLTEYLHEIERLRGTIANVPASNNTYLREHFARTLHGWKARALSAVANVVAHVGLLTDQLRTVSNGKTTVPGRRTKGHTPGKTRGKGGNRPQSN